MAKETEANQQSEKLKALQAAMSKIEKDFGKGSIMRMGDEQIENVDVIPSGSMDLMWHSVWADIHVVVSSKYMDLSHQERLLWRYMQSQKRKKWAVLQPSLMQNTPLIASMQRNLGLMLTTFG